MSVTHIIISLMCGILTVVIAVLSITIHIGKVLENPLDRPFSGSYNINLKKMWAFSIPAIILFGYVPSLFDPAYTFPYAALLFVLLLMFMVLLTPFVVICDILAIVGSIDSSNKEYFNVKIWKWHAAVIIGWAIILTTAPHIGFNNV